MRGGVVLDEVDLVKMGRGRSCEPWQGIWCYPKDGGKFTRDLIRNQSHELTFIQQEDV